MNQLSETHLFDEVDHLVQTGIDMPPVIAHRADSDLGPLPEILIPDLRDGDIESMPDPIDHLSKDMTLSFERMILRNPKIKLANSNNHRFPLPFSSFGI
jgi:hypothetical protein